eukprot:3419750-Rhodomonas_salina.2
MAVQENGDTAGACGHRNEKNRNLAGHSGFRLRKTIPGSSISDVRTGHRMDDGGTRPCRRRRCQCAKCRRSASRETTATAADDADGIMSETCLTNLNFLRSGCCPLRMC